ncbi:hypothetical protein [Actinoplanes sp. NPDC051851]|uniref:hypothetical protein n=1 Tax=Actinoplanes sp. NPDC051851 TaxID=3154753 RepID=UPI00342CA6EB
MTDPQGAPERNEATPLTVILLAAAALAWTAAMLWSARATITGRADAEMEVTSTAYALPGAVTADLVAGAAVALLALTLIGRLRALGPTVRFAVATGAGLLTGLVSAIPMVTINTSGTIYAVLGGTVAAAATIGGAVAGFRIPQVVAATGAAALAVFLIGFVLNLFQSPILTAFGAGDTESSVNAAQWFSYSQAALSGLAAGLLAYAIVRRARFRNTDGADLRWPMYALAGAGPGLLVMIGEVLTRTAGSQILELAGKVSELEQSVQQTLSTSRLNNAMIVLFVGAITTIIAVGRTLSSPDDEDEDGLAEDATTASSTAPESSTASESGAAPESSAAPADDDSPADGTSPDAVAGSASSGPLAAPSSPVSAADASAEADASADTSASAPADISDSSDTSETSGVEPTPAGKRA